MSSSYPRPEQVLTDLGEKVTDALRVSVFHAARDLQKYRESFPSWLVEHTERGLANWIHDRLWSHLTRRLLEHEDVHLSEAEPTREVVVGIHYRIRIKRHHERGRISTYATQTALEFYSQGTQNAFPGMEELRLAGGYVWNADTREIGEPVLSLRDGLDNVVWEVALPEDMPRVSTLSPFSGPPVPSPPAPTPVIEEGADELNPPEVFG